MQALLKSLLFVPGDSERKQAKGLASAADALILDLEDSVDSSRLPEARVRVRELLQSHPERSRQQLWVRVNALSSGRLLEDLTAVIEGRPDGIVLPKVNSPADVLEVAHYLTALEARDGTVAGSVRLIVLATETPQGLLALPRLPADIASSPSAAQRLAGLTWGMEDLSAALGASGKLAADGSMTFTFQLARSTCLLAAASLGVSAIDTVFVDFRDAAGFRREVQAARRDGFTGKLAIHPDQVPVINEVFTPSAAEIERAQRIIAAFASSPGAGVASLDGQMIDRPHLVHAQRTLEAAGNLKPAHASSSLSKGDRS